ncbi:hypothetical protein ABZ782_28340 [Streptomyces asoensis]|uniref:hypothetical protein n=1 Tax=Streptomyces asoensis TaxID=249586 RepID=UPI0033DA8900
MNEETEHIPGLLDPDPRVLSANQLVSYNLMRARRAAGLSQEDVAGVLEKLTGRSWSNASVSAAERAWRGRRPRRFDAGEILAMSFLFNEPIAFFFLPPGPDEYAAEYVATREFEEGRPDLRFNYDKLSVIPTRAYVTQLALTEPTPSFSMRLQELCKKWLVSEWSKPKLAYLGKYEYDVSDEDIDWSAVEETAQEVSAERAREVERALSPEHRQAFLDSHADDLARRIAEYLDQMGSLQGDRRPWGRGERQGGQEEPPPF